MPKDRRSPSCRCRVSPYSRSYKDADKRAHKSSSPPIGNVNEFEEARCPICMEHPHNAVLLRCSSHEKGCRPYICNTSPRHSNCLDQFRKSTKLACPLCRGRINGWTVVNTAREFMNSKIRNCSLGTCAFEGNYSQLRTHARQEHPCVRPTDVDPERQIQWTTLQEDSERQDLLNMQFAPDDDDADNDDDLVDFMTIANWDFDLDNLNSSESDSENHRFWEDFDNLFSSSTSLNRLLGIPQENTRTTRNRTGTRVRQRSNGQPSSRNRR